MHTDKKILSNAFLDNFRWKKNYEEDYLSSALSTVYLKLCYVFRN